MTDTPHRPGPEDEGIPDHADDTSTAFNEADRPRFESPPAMPADHPLGVDEHGVTATEAREGESLEQRLAREEPQTSADQPGPEGDGGAAEEVAVHEITDEELPYEP